MSWEGTLRSDQLCFDRPSSLTVIGVLCEQDGSGSKLAPKLVNKIKGTMDWGISKLIGGPPPSAPVADSFGYRPLENGDHFGSQSYRPGSSAGQRSGTLMAPSASIATSMERLPQEPNRGPARSQSEPDFGRNAKQVLAWTEEVLTLGWLEVWSV